MSGNRETNVFLIGARSENSAAQNAVRPYNFDAICNVYGCIFPFFEAKQHSKFLLIVFHIINSGQSIY